MSRAMPHFHSGRLYSSVFDPARWNKATRPTVTSHHALATLQMHERERKNSPPAALSSHCLSPLPLYPLWMSLKKKAGSFPPDWLKALILFCPTFQQCLRCVCVCVGTDSWHLMAFLAAGVFERILSNGLILVTSCRPLVSVLSSSWTHSLLYVQKHCNVHESEPSCRFQLFEGRGWKNLALCLRPPLPFVHSFL